LSKTLFRGLPADIYHKDLEKLVLDQPDDAVLEFIKDVRRQLREQGN
jgi:hypothetical protein